MNDFEIVLNSIKRCVKDDLVDSEMKKISKSLPKVSWLKRVRLALQLSSSEVAKRLKVSRQNYAELEKSEEAGRISLAKLERVAGVLGYELVYGFRPIENGSPPIEKIAQEVLEDVKGHGYLKSAKGVFRERRLAWLAATRFCCPEYRKSKGWASNPKGRLPYDMQGRRHWQWPDRYRW